MPGIDAEINPQPLPPKGLDTFIEAIANGVMRAVESRQAAQATSNEPSKLMGRLICGVIWDPVVDQVRTTGKEF